MVKTGESVDFRRKRKDVSMLLHDFKKAWTGEMAQWAEVAWPEDLSSIPRTHSVEGITC